MNKKPLFRPSIVRSERVALRLSPFERHKIEDFCLKNGMSLSDFVRQCIALAEPSLVEKDITR